MAMIYTPYSIMAELKQANNYNSFLCILLLAMLGSTTIVVAHHMYSMPPYLYLATNYGTQLSLFTHHMWIGGFLIVGATAHAAIFMVRDYDPTTRYNDLLDRVLRHPS